MTFWGHLEFFQTVYVLMTSSNRLDFYFFRNKVAAAQTSQGSKTEGGNTVNSQTDPAERGGLSGDNEHIMLSQVQYFSKS